MMDQDRKAAPPEDPEHPRSLGIPDHTLLDPIASGAYGEVWLARNAVGTLRAVKVVRRDRHACAETFERELKGLQKFEPVSRAHEGLVDILTLGLLPEGAGFYYVMELADAAEPLPRVESGALRVEGKTGDDTISQLSTPTSLNYSPRTLRSELKSRGALPTDEAIALGLKLTAALAHLHAAGLVHRDVKPSNILFIGGEPKLADAGLVAGVDDARSLVGTAGYIAPEGPGTPQADLYALGKVLYEVAFGKDRQEFPALPADVASRADHARLLELNEIIATACAHDPQQRYGSAAAMYADLKRLEGGKSVKRQRTRQQVGRLAVRLGVGVAVVIAAWFAFFRFDSSTNRPVASPASVFILPFSNDGTKAVPEDLRGRMTDAFINSLKQIEGVTVAQRRSALADRPLAEARTEADRLFNARYVLAGRLKSDDALTLRLDLLETGRELPIWSRSFSGTTNHLIELEEQALRALASALHIPIPPNTSQRIGQSLTNNLAAWGLVAQADRESELPARERLGAALQHYNEALQLDPDYILALAHKAQFLRNQSGDRWPNEIWPEIKASAERMLQIDPTSGQGSYFRWITQFLYEWDWEGAESTFRERRARQADWPVVTALYLRTVGRTDEARIEQDKVKELDQRSLALRYHTAAAAFVERNYQRSIAVSRETLAVFPDAIYCQEWLFHGHYHLGQFDQALASSRQARRLQDGPSWQAMEACALAKLGQKEAAVKILAELETMSGVRYVDPYPLAWVHLALGDQPGALAKLREACQTRSEMVVFPDVAGGLRTDPKLDELRDEPGFQELLKLAGLDVWPK